MLRIKRTRIQYERWAERIVILAFNKQFNAWYDRNRVGILNLSGVDLDRSYVRGFYLDIYNTVGFEFANKTYNELTGDKLKFNDLPIRTKNDAAKFNLIMQQFIDNQLASRITNVNGNTERVLRSLIVQAKNEGLGELETAKLIRSNYQEFTKVRAKTIARTEIISSSNYGSLQGAKLTGLNLQKEWIASIGGSNDRQDHTDYDGTLVGIDDKFLVGGEYLEYPGDVNGSAGNVINCACTIGYKRLD